jgi:acyl carrier protein
MGSGPQIAGYGYVPASRRLFAAGRPSGELMTEVNSANGDFEGTKARVSELFTRMHVAVPSVETDLFDSGILDSQKLVELLFFIEQDFKTAIDVEDFEIENFRCIEKIAALLMERKNRGSVPQLTRAGGSPV